jgi:hypothetical protein
MRITNLPLNHWLPEHALVSSTRLVVSFSLIQSVSLNGVNPAFHPMFVGLVLAGVVRNAEDLLHSFEESCLKRLALIFFFYQRKLKTLGYDAAIPPEQSKLVHYLSANETKSGETYGITIFEVFKTNLCKTSSCQNMAREAKQGVTNLYPALLETFQPQNGIHAFDA